MKVDQKILEWQRKFDPCRFNKATGAQYHTAPAVLLPGAHEIPNDAPGDSISVMFRVSPSAWISSPEKMEITYPMFVEKAPKSKMAKHGPVFVLGQDAAVLAIPTNENYYWTAQVLCSQRVFKLSLAPGKMRDDGRISETVCVATFLPGE